MSCGISTPFEVLSPSLRQVIHVLLTRAPLYSLALRQTFPFDLHVLGTPPALILSQDQTLMFNPISSSLSCSRVGNLLASFTCLPQLSKNA
jgi:hypothetical protein